MGRGAQQHSPIIELSRQSVPIADQTLLPPYERLPDMIRPYPTSPTLTCAEAKIVWRLAQANPQNDEKMLQLAAEDRESLSITVSEYQRLFTSLARRGLIHRLSEGWQASGPGFALVRWDQEAPETLTAKIPAAQAIEWTDRLGDGLGLGVDEKIKPLVAGLLRFGIETTASCEGHAERGAGYPWVSFEPWAFPAVRRLLVRAPELREFGLDDRAALRRLCPAPVCNLLRPERLQVRIAAGQRRRWREQLRALGGRLLVQDRV